MHDLARKFESCIVWLNTVHTLSPSLGYGGYRDSSIGLEEGIEVMEQYMTVKKIRINYGEYTVPFQKQ
ncbi:aldehyde dehydrogenase family protein [Viridibacillus sp. YIM B01967]|uniref:Aldehyde dehydrogenase family protein n=1 Tax=Viridibacillus soli TaxID=2798301 RepID=A0ABS1H6Q5_9BACL|nr:aldehyde dehydrogenase family protein [Viridibacillus soli]